MKVPQLHHLWKRFTHIKSRYFFIVAGVFLVFGVYGLRANNLKMAELRAAVYAADRDNKDVQTALTNLQRFVTSHMNTDLSGGSENAVYPPIQLKYTYERLQEAESKKSNESVYMEAQAHCERQNPNDFSGRNRVPCIQEYVTSHGVQQRLIPDALYKYDFVSPTWSPDMAGFGLLGAGLFGSIGAISWAARKFQKRRSA
jgi:hypothetical protein